MNHRKMLARALAHYEAGRSAEADDACAALLARWPRDADALNLRAVIACRAGRFADGVALLERLLKQQPANIQALTTLGDAYHALEDRERSVDAFVRAVKAAPRNAVLQSRLGTAQLEAGRVAEAEAAYRSSILLDDRVARSHFNHGVALHRLDRAADATSAYRTAIARDPNFVAAYLNLGNVLMDRQQLEEAVVVYRAAVARDPRSPEGHANLGLALLRQGDLDGADAALCRALESDADCAVAYACRGALRREQGRPGEAVSDCELAIRLKPDLAESYVTLGGALLELDQPKAALPIYRQAIALTPDHARLHSHLGVALIRLDRIEEAAQACRAAIELQPHYAPAHTNYGVALQRLDRIGDAITAHRTAIALDPAFPKAWSNLAESLKEEGQIDEALQASRMAVSLPGHEPIQSFNYALALLMEGAYEAGWPAYESRRQAGVLAPHERRFAVPEWRGESLAGRTLLLHAEQGLGDTIQFARFVQGLLAPSVTIVIECQRPLVGLLQASLGAVRVVAQGEPLPPFDLHLPLMSLPYVLGTRLDTIPAAVPYLAADRGKTTRWRGRIGVTAELSVGIVWSGNPDHKSDARRSLAAAAVLPALAIPGVRLFSLQKDVRAADVAALETMAGTVTDLSPWLDDFTETAAAIETLDLVIAVDTSVAHLAGALGRPVWMMTPYALDWRWLRDRADSPWYPTMRLFRQAAPRAWDDVISRIRDGLAEWVVQRASPLQPGLPLDTARLREAIF